MSIETIMRTSAVIPVLVIDDAATAKPLAEALVAGGLNVLEVTLRTPAALDAIREMKKVPGAIVGAGTVVNTDQFAQVMDAGGEFIAAAIVFAAALNRALHRIERGRKPAGRRLDLVRRGHRSGHGASRGSRWLIRLMPGEGIGHAVGHIRTIPRGVLNHGRLNGRSHRKIPVQQVFSL